MEDCNNSNTILSLKAYKHSIESTLNEQISESRTLYDRLKQLLETTLSSLSPAEPSSCCEKCAFFRERAEFCVEMEKKSIRTMFMRNEMREFEMAQVHRRLRFLKMGNLELSMQHDELKGKERHVCRDGEIEKLTAQINNAKRTCIEANNAAFEANMQSTAYGNEIARIEGRMIDLEMEKTRKQLTRATTIIDTMQGMTREDAKTHTVGLCDEPDCVSAFSLLSFKEREERLQLKSLRSNRERARHELARMVAECEHWRQMVEEETKLMSGENFVVNVDFDLKVLLQNVFQIIPQNTDGHLEETFMYDQFMLRQRDEDRDWVLQKLHSSCHSERLVKRRCIERPCKQSFSACLRAIGGVSKKRGTRTVWVNIEIKNNPECDLA
jgi:hypothetical protein